MQDRAETYRLVKHFHDEGKLDSMTGIERVLAEDLELRRAWRDLKSAERDLNRIIKQRLNEAERDEFDTEMCGGCGAIHPDQRCIGCLHDFYPRKKNV